MVIYMDESGNLGKRGRYFVITLVVYKDKQAAKRSKRIIKKYCQDSKKEELKGREVPFNEKQILINKLNREKDHEIFYICLDKTKLRRKELFNDKNALFNFMSLFLFEAVVKRIKQELGEDDVDLVINADNRSIKVDAIYQLEEYISLKATDSWDYKGKIQITYYDSRQSHGIQVADLISSILSYKYNSGQNSLYRHLNIVRSIKFPRATFGS